MAALAENLLCLVEAIMQCCEAIAPQHCVTAMRLLSEWLTVSGAVTQWHSHCRKETNTAETSSAVFVYSSIIH